MTLVGFDSAFPNPFPTVEEDANGARLVHMDKKAILEGTIIRIKMIRSASFT
jgi:hypothetical protein